MTEMDILVAVNDRLAERGKNPTPGVLRLQVEIEYGAGGGIVRGTLDVSESRRIRPIDNRETPLPGR